MKKSVLMGAVCLMLTGQTLLAQQNQPSKTEVKNKKGENTLTYTTKLSNSRDSQLQISLFDSKVRIVGHDRDEILIEAQGHRPPPARAEGLKPLYNQAEDNTGVGLSVQNEGGKVRIEKASREHGTYTLKVPNQVALLFEETNWSGGSLDISDFNGEIELKLNNADVNLTNISGPVVANSTTSDLVLKFRSLNQNRPSSITTVSGDLSIHLPADTKANLKMKSITGEIYSDFDIELAKEAKTNLRRVSGGNTLEGKTNGGGVEINLYTISGDMFIRKSK